MHGFQSTVKEGITQTAGIPCLISYHIGLTHLDEVREAEKRKPEAYWWYDEGLSDEGDFVCLRPKGVSKQEVPVWCDFVCLRPKGVSKQEVPVADKEIRQMRKSCYD